MAIKKSYAVFGLGRYGIAVARELARNGADVLAVDEDEIVVNEMAMEIPLCKCADVTDINVLEKLGIANFDVVVVAMASNLEASVMATTLCKEMGVPHIVVKCANEMHQKIFAKVGADDVVFPENESGNRLAKNLLSGGFVDIVELSDEISVVSIDVTKEWVNKTLAELNLRKKYGINVIAISKNGKVSIEVNPTLPLTEDMELVVVADATRVNNLLRRLKL